jgi:glycosyltransferase involved in cell wall biosynthesis
MIEVTLVIIAFNEEQNVKKCLDSVSFTSEKIVVDSGSTDQTRQIAENCGAKVFRQNWLGYGKQKQFAIEKASNDWILLLDADEFLTEELNHEIFQMLSENKLDSAAYRLPIKQIFMGKQLHFGRAVSEPIRFYNKKSGDYDLKNIHESFITSEKVGTLNGFAAHNSAVTIKERIDKIFRDTKLELEHSTSSPKLSDVFVSPFVYFFAQLLKKDALKDGIRGIILAGLFSFQIFLHNYLFYKKNHFNQPRKSP